MKRSLLLPALLLCALSGLSQNLTITTDVPDESTEAYFDVYFEVTLNMSTMYGTVYLDVSEKGGVQSMAIRNDYDFDESDTYPPGSSIHYNGGGDNTMISSYWLASASNQGYDGYERLGMKVRVTPNQSGEIDLYYRATYINGDTEVREPFFSSWTDQQLWKCYKATILNKPEKLPNVYVKDIEVNDGNQVYINDQVKIKVVIEEDNGVDAGKVGINYFVNNAPVDEPDDPDDYTGQLDAYEDDSEWVYHTFDEVGSNQIKVIVDPYDELPEDDEDDNVEYHTINVKATPTVSITSGPVDGSTISDPAVTFTWSGSDEDGTIVGYEVEVNGAGESTTATSKSFIAREGDNDFKVRSIDNDGLYSDWAARSFSYSPIDISPVIVITSGPADGSTVSDPAVTFTWSGSDEDGPVVGYEVEVNGAGESTTATSKSFIAREGENEFRVRAMDNDGLYSDWAARSFSYNPVDIPPTVAITSGPADGSTISDPDVTFGWSGSDEDGTVTEYQLEINGVEERTEATSTSFTALEGANAFRVRAMDNDGHYSDWAEIRFILDVPVKSIDVGGIKIYADNISGEEGGLRTLSGNVSINDYLHFTGTVHVDQSTNLISGAGDVSLSNIKGIGEVSLISGEFGFEVPLEQERLLAAGIEKANQAFELVNLPVHLDGIILLEDGVEIFGIIELPKIMGAISSEINQIRLTRSNGLEVIGLVALDEPVKIKSITLEHLLFDFNTIDNEFRGEGIIKTGLFKASAGVYIVEEGLDSIGVWVEVERPQPLGTTGLALSGAGGYVTGIQRPPMTIGLGTTLVSYPSLGGVDFISFDQLMLEYTLGVSMHGSGNFALFDIALAHASFDIERERIRVGVDVNFEDVILAYMEASMVKNQMDSFDFIGRFGGILQVPAEGGFPWGLTRTFIRLIEPEAEFPYPLAGADNVIFNTELSGRVFVNRANKDPFRLSYLLKYKNKKLKSKFALNFSLFNEDVFIPDPNARNPLTFMNSPDPNNRFEGRSLIIDGAGVSNGRSQAVVAQDFVITEEVDVLIVRISGDDAPPDFSLLLPDEQQLSGEEANEIQNMHYLSNAESSTSYFYIDDAEPGNYQIEIEDTGDQYYIDILGTTDKPVFRFDSVRVEQQKAYIHWSDQNNSDDANINLYFDDDAEGANGIPIVQNISEDDESDAFEWDISGIDPGIYFLYAIMKDSLGDQLVTYHSESIVVENNELESPTQVSYSIENDTLMLTWEKPSSCIACNYLVYESNSGLFTSSTTNINVGDTGVYIIDNPAFGSTKYYSLRTLDTLGRLSAFSDSLEVSLISDSQNNAPQITSVDYPEVLKQGDTVFIAVSYTDVDQDLLTVKLSVSPVGASITNNEINFIATDVGLNRFTLIADDGNGGIDSVSFDIAVLNPILYVPSLQLSARSVYNYGDEVDILVTNPNIMESDEIEISIRNKTRDQDAILLLKKKPNEKYSFGNRITLDRYTDLETHTFEVSRRDTVLIKYAHDSVVYDRKIVFSAPNYIPENLAISNLSVDENRSNVFVGVISAIDYDNDTLEFSIPFGIDEFAIVGDSLKTVKELDFEEQAYYTLPVKVSDGLDNITADFTISVNDVNEKPTDILLSSDTILENMEIGSVIGILATKDEDYNDAFNYSIDSGSEMFEINENELRSRVLFDYEESATEFVEIISTDQGGLKFTKIFKISIINVDNEVTGIDELREALAVYPNPTGDYLFIQWNKFEGAIMTDLSGRKLLKSNSSTLDLRALRAGVYLVMLEGTENERITIRIIKQ